MADINFFSRLSNLWTGFVSLWIADVEKEHPEIAYENAIRSATERFVQVRNATAALIRERPAIMAPGTAGAGRAVRSTVNLNL